MTDPIRVRADHVLTPAGVVDDLLVAIDGAMISSCRPPHLDEASGPEPERVRGWLVPGFVDTHVHGGGGSDFATDDPEDVLTARSFHAAHGTTTSLASLVTADVDALCRQLDLLVDLVADGHLAGVHLEGPFLSPARAGAHRHDLLRAPEPALVERLLDAGRGTIAMVTLAPELPGALGATQRLVAAGVRVAVGHTDADDSQVAAVLDAGATVATHLFNAMRPVHHREPGPVPRLLTDPRVGVELIADGRHLHPAVLGLAVTAAGPERTALVTDAMAAAGMPDGEYVLGGQPVAVRDRTARISRPDGDGPIAGSTATLDEAVRTMSGLLEDLPTAVAMASTTPARRFGLTDVGVIAAGSRADLCVLDDDATLLRVMRGGRWLPLGRSA